MNWLEAYNEYLNYVEYNLKPQSKNSLKERFENIINPFFKDYKITDIKEIDYLNFQIMINKKNYSNNYKSNIHYLICGFYTYLIKFYNIKKNIPKLVGNFKMNNERKIYNTYNIKEFKRFIKCFDNKIYKEFFNLLFFTGCRPGEAMALRFSDLKGNYISINKTMNEHGKREITTPKTKNSIRTIIIDRRLKRNLLKLKKYYISLYKNTSYDYYIFGGIKPLAPTTINRYKICACKKANLNPIKLHEFRHSHATMLLEKNIVINEISRRLGHSKTSTTLNIYCHTNKEQEKKVLKTLNSIRLFKL